MSDVAERVLALPPHQQALLLRQLKRKTAPPEAEPPSTEEQRDRWIIRFRPQAEARMRLFCFAYAGGGASMFRPWSHGLPADIEVCAIQLPGRENRMGEAAHTSMALLLTDLAAAIAPYLDRPFAFFGHSMGALVSFELARELRRSHDRHPFGLYLGAFRAPQLPNPNIRIHHLPVEVFKVVLEAEGIPRAILQNEELMQRMMTTLRADFEVCDTYHYRKEAPLECPLWVFGGQDDIRVRPDDLEGWSAHTTASCELSILPGTHFFVHSAQERLLDIITQSLLAQLSFAANPTLVDGTPA